MRASFLLSLVTAILLAAKIAAADNVTEITDDGLVEIGRLENLMELNLIGTRIGDQGLTEIGKQAALSKLDVNETLDGLQPIEILVRE